MAPTTHDEWFRRVKGYTQTKSDADAHAIADLCVSKGWNVYHAFATFYGCKCYCAACAPAFRMPPGLNRLY